MTTEQILKVIASNDALLQIVEKTINIAGPDFSIADLINGTNAQIAQINVDCEDYLKHYDDDDDNYNNGSMWDLDFSMLPDNFHDDY